MKSECLPLARVCRWPGTHTGSHHSLGESSRQGILQGALHKVTWCLWNWVCILSSLIWFFRSQCSRQNSLLMYISHARFRSLLFGQSSMETPPMTFWNGVWLGPGNAQLEWTVMSAVDTLLDSWQAWDYPDLVLVSYYYFNAPVNSCLPKWLRTRIF